MEETPNPIQSTPIQPTAAPPQPTRPKRRAAIALIIFLIVVAVISVLVFKHVSKQSKASTPPAAASVSKQVASVSIGANDFTPKAITVTPGTTVKWTVNDPTSTHIIASDPYPADNTLSSLKSKQIGNGASYSYTFTTKGTYTYHDNLHPTTTGTVIVK